MALDPLQKLIAETALTLPEARTLALTGGGAMIAHGYTDRSTRDIDLGTGPPPRLPRRRTTSHD